jgi:4a-hydroxytetrahydrobiopterin dehydratase
LEFVNQVAALAEKSDHHPDIILSYRKVRLELSTHSEGGLTEHDFIFASEVNALPTDR